MGAVAEQHGAGAALVGDDALDVANGAVFDELAGLDPGVHPAAGVVDEQGDAGVGDGFDDAVGVGQGGGDGLLTEDALDAGCDAVDANLGVDRYHR